MSGELNSPVDGGRVIGGFRSSGQAVLAAKNRPIGVLPATLIVVPDDLQTLPVRSGDDRADPAPEGCFPVIRRRPQAFSHCSTRPGGSDTIGPPCCPTSHAAPTTCTP